MGKYCNVKFTLSCYIASQHIQELLEAVLLNIHLLDDERLENAVFKIIYYLFEDGIEKSVPRNHHLSSLGKPRDGFFYPILTLMICPFSVYILKAYYSSKT